MPVVTVVIPAYNAEATLAETLDSLLAQTFTDYEAIVVDDGSADGTARLAAGTGDPRVQVLGVENGGVAQARNRAIAQARGELVAFLDADDLWEPRKLELQVQALRERPQAGWSVTGGVRIDARSREIAPLPLLGSDDVCRTLLLHSMAVGHLSSGMVRKPVIEGVGGFDTRFSQCADWDLWLRLGASSAPAIVEDRLLRYRTSAGNMSSDVALLERDTFAVLAAFYASAAGRRYDAIRAQVYSAHWMVCAGAYLQQRRLRDSLRCLYRGTVAYPASIGRALGLPARRLRRSLSRPAGGATG